MIGIDLPREHFELASSVGEPETFVTRSDSESTGRAEEHLGGIVHITNREVLGTTDTRELVSQLGTATEGLLSAGNGEVATTECDAGLVAHERQDNPRSPGVKGQMDRMWDDGF